MNNKQWLIWQMIDMPPEELAHMLDVVWFCDNCCDGEIRKACDSDCRGNMVDWLEMEHEENE